MPNNSLSYPKVCKRKDGKYYVDFKLNNKRYSITSTLAKQVYEFIVKNDYSLSKPKPTLEIFDSLIEKKLNEPLSDVYRKALKSYAIILRQELITKGVITSSFIDSIPLRYNNNTSYNSIRRHINVLVNHLHNNFPIGLSRLKTRKQEEVLHSPINNVGELLSRIRDFNMNLYLCCLMTYGCLLRPHQEICLLKWENFSDDLSYINLTGSKVKSKRNRIVPVPTYIKKVLKRRCNQNNIFSNTLQPYNKGYFSLLWRRFKRFNPDIDKHITIYSFRHTGALEIFKRTGSVTKLQKAMGHSSIKVSLTYLRGLEVPELSEEDMPMI